MKKYKENGKKTDFFSNKNYCKIYLFLTKWQQHLKSYIQNTKNKMKNKKIMKMFNLRTEKKNIIIMTIIIMFTTCRMWKIFI